MSANSTRRARSRKAADRPKKPYPEFPLYPHPLGYWSKKIRGKILNFGRWGRVVNGKLTRVEGDGWEDALKLYKVQADDWHAGRTPRATSKDGLTVADLCNRFLTAKKHRLDAGKVSPRMFAEYKATTDRLVGAFGGSRLVDDLAADDFSTLLVALEKQYGPVRQGNEVQKVRTVFKFAYDEGLITAPTRYGSQFKKPSASEMRRHRAKNGERMLEAAQLRDLIDAAPVPLKAMVLLGINAGFGNHDVATLPLAALDLDDGWIDYPRPKTGIARRCPLWPETVEAIRAAIAERPEPRHDDAKPLVFVTTRGRPWLVGGIANPVSVACRDLMKRVKAHGKGIGFYTLRHVFRTVADGAKDQVAANAIMGHADSHISARYREQIDDDQLRAVADHVHRWLWPAPEGDGAETDEGQQPAKRSAQNVTPAPQPAERPRLRLWEGGAA
jgi:integrase